MLLTLLSLQNFRCYQQISDVPLHRLTVFIGENDAGKTVFLEAVRILLTESRPLRTDFRQISKGVYSDKIILEAKFTLDKEDTLPNEWRTINGESLILRKTFGIDGSSSAEAVARRLKDQRFANFNNADAGTQKELLNSIGLEPAANKELRVAQLTDAIEGELLETEEGFIDIQFAQLVDHLPIFELTSATDFEQPHQIVQKTLQSVVNSCIKKPSLNSDSPPELIPELKSAHDLIEKSLNSKMAEAIDALKAIYPKIKDITANPRIDFSRSVQIPELLLDCDDGHGPKPISSFGDGTKKRLWMGLLEWQRKAEKQADRTSTIRAYDEPDTSLHYEAQRKLFSNMVAATSSLDSKTQVLVCTHSLALVDRAPGESINLIRVNEEGRQIEFLKGSADPDVKQFLSSVGRSVGITNSALFYERVFVIVEGPSEENSLPILYRNLFQRSLVEDGIVLVNINGSGAWQPFLKLLGANKAESTLLLLDSDCQLNGSGVRLTPGSLRSVGFDSSFLTNNVIFIGTKEFEDAFRNEDVAAVLQMHYPKVDSTPWSTDEVDKYRLDSSFIKALFKDAGSKCDEPAHRLLKKPEFSTKLAEECSTQGQIPDAVLLLFEKARLMAKCLP